MKYYIVNYVTFILAQSFSYNIFEALDFCCTYDEKIIAFSDSNCFQSLKAIAFYFTKIWNKNQKKAIAFSDRLRQEICSLDKPKTYSQKYTKM